MFVARRSFGKFSKPKSPISAPIFKYIALEPISQQKVTQHNIDLIIFKDYIVNYKRVKDAAYTFNTLIVCLFDVPVKIFLLVFLKQIAK